MKPPHRFLSDALLLPDAQAAEAWRQWRAVADLDHLDVASFHMLPLLSGRLTAWVDGDPQGSVILGICRRAWTQRQVATRTLLQATETLRQARVEGVAAVGPLVWGALYWPEKAVRTSMCAYLLLEPATLPNAIGALLRSGWTEPSQRTPVVSLRSPSGDEARLTSRVLPFADLPFLPSPLPALETVELGHTAVATVPAEYALITVLCGYFNDGVDWRCDALMICRAAHIDWKRVAALARWRSEARRRLAELSSSWPADVPDLAMRPNPFESAMGILMRAYRGSRHQEE